MAQHLAVAERVQSAATRHLIHRPRSAGHFLLDSRSTEEERFALAGGMPDDHPLFNDGLGQMHDSQLFVEIARNVGAFIGRRYFRFPLDRFCRLDSIEFALSPAAWRVSDDPAAHLAMDIYAAPAPAVTGGSGGLRLRGTMEIDGVAACTGHADLGFVTPDGHGHHRPAGRPWSGGRAPAYDLAPADPYAVGRCDPRNVVVTTPAPTDDGLSTQLLVDAGHPVFFPDGGGSVPGLLLVEAIRQSSMLTAARTHGFSPLHTCVTRAAVRFRGDAALDLPLTCTTRTAPAGGDLAGTPSARIRATIEQLGRVVAEAEVTLTHAV